MFVHRLPVRALTCSIAVLRVAATAAALGGPNSATGRAADHGRNQNGNRRPSQCIKSVGYRDINYEAETNQGQARPTGNSITVQCKQTRFDNVPQFGYSENRSHQIMGFWGNPLSFHTGREPPAGFYGGFLGECNCGENLHLHTVIFERTTSCRASVARWAL